MRKQPGKERRDLDDIVGLFKATDPDIIPVFVARDLERLPPVTCDHLDVTKLLKDMTLHKTEIEVIKMSYATVNQLEEVENVINPRCNVNTKRGAYLDSGPMGMTHLNETVSYDEEHIISTPLPGSDKLKSAIISESAKKEGVVSCVHRLRRRRPVQANKYALKKWFLLRMTMAI